MARAYLRRSCGPLDRPPTQRRLTTINSAAFTALAIPPHGEAEASSRSPTHTTIARSAASRIRQQVSLTGQCLNQTRDIGSDASFSETELRQSGRISLFLGDRT